MNWQEIRSHPQLTDLPFKLETDRWGHIDMSSASNRHSWLQSEIQSLLRQHVGGGYAVIECSIDTREGTKVADIAWASAEFLRHHGAANPYPQAPEIIVEALSASNCDAEMEEKKGLYFGRGARESWLCSEDGAIMTFYDTQGPL